ncbi:MAG: hypothetical protein CMH70_00400 [Nitrosomonadaceae bacterium]|nr:hypothetical protein [Nitrosomonadaceae bacterium]|tara:strand:+ start:5643 stop:8609 length:2967 start_codon:yes stop_codon:yes gene_type:complete
MRSRKKFWVLAIAGILFVALAVLDNSHGLEKYYKKLIGQLVAKKTLIKRDILQAVVDLGMVGFGERTQLPLMRISLSRNDIAHIQHLYSLSLRVEVGSPINWIPFNKLNDWRKAELELKGKNYKIKYKYQGRSPSGHHYGRYNSLAIKLQKGELIEGTNRFNLIIGPRIALSVIQKLFFAEELGIITQRHKWARVKINNWPERVFHFEYPLDNDFMESRGNSSYWRLAYKWPVASSHKSLTYIHDLYPVTTEDTSIHPLLDIPGYGLISFKQLTSRLKTSLVNLGIPEGSHRSIIERYLAFHEAIINKDSDRMLQFFDQDYIATYAASRLFLAFGSHGATPDNFFNFYNQANGLFYPAISRDDWEYNALSFIPQQSIEKQLYQLPLFRVLSQDDSFRQKKYKTIKNVIDIYPLNIEKKLKEIQETRFDHLNFGWADAVIKRILPITKDTHSLLQLNTPLAESNTSIAGYNLKVLATYLSEANPSLTVWAKNNILTIAVEPRSMSAIGFDRLEIRGFDAKLGIAGSKNISLTQFRDNKTTIKNIPVETFKVSSDGVLNLTDFVKKLEFFNGLDYNSNLLKTKYVLKVELDGVEVGTLTNDALMIEMGNRIMEEEIPKSNITIKLGADSAYPDVSSAMLEPENLTGLDRFNAIQERFPHINMSKTNKNELIIHPGVYEIVDDFVVPKELKVIIESGTTLLMGEKVVLVGYQGVDIRGTADAPVIVKALNPSKPYGSIGFLGGEKTKSTINYFYQSGGSERWINGIFFSGGFSIHYNKEIVLRNSRIKDNYGGDGVNLKYVDDVLIESTLFQDNSVDHLDLDSSNGRVINSKFFNSKPKDLNGDGIDVSFSKMLIFHSSFSGFNDKGISIGERSSVIIQRSRLENNNIGAAVKDLSRAFFINTDFKSNSKDIAAYRKKRFFGGGYAYIQTSSLDENKIVYDVDRQSKLFILDNQLIQKASKFNPKNVDIGSILKTFAEMRNRPVDSQLLDN